MRSELTIDLANMEKDDIFVVLPVAEFGLHTEPGDPFSPEFERWLWAMAGIGYWPVDFGEANDTHITLWLKYEPGVAAKQTTHFIKKGGDV